MENLWSKLILVLWVVLIANKTFGASQMIDIEISEDTTKIDHSNQDFTQLDMDYSAYNDLVEINLSNNHLSFISPDVFKLNSKLKIIDLSGNKELGFPEVGTFLESTVEVLNMSDCNVEYIPANALDGFPELDVLDLSNNPINFEESLAFHTMCCPPRELIVSKITQTELEFVCRKMHMKIYITDEDKVVHCKEVRKHKKENKDVSVVKIMGAVESDDALMEIDEGLVSDNHLDVMLSDDPMEGSGMSETEIDNSNLEDNNEQNQNKLKTKEKNQTSDPIGDVKTEDEVKQTSGVDQTPEQTPDFVKAPVVNMPDAVPTSDVVQVPNVPDFIKTSDIVQTPDIVKIPDVAHTAVQTLNAIKKSDVVQKSDGLQQSNIVVQFSGNDQTRDIIDIEKNNQHKENNDNKSLDQLKPSTNLRKSNIPNKEASETDFIDSVGNGDKTHEPIKEIEKTGELQEGSTSSSNVILILVIAAVVVGSVVVGWKKYKDRKTGHLPVPQLDREMQDMSTKPKPQESEPFIKSTIECENEMQPNTNGNAKKQHDDDVIVTEEDNNKNAEHDVKTEQKEPEIKNAPKE